MPFVSESSIFRKREKREPPTPIYKGNVFFVDVHRHLGSERFLNSENRSKIFFLLLFRGFRCNESPNVGGQRPLYIGECALRRGMNAFRENQVNDRSTFEAIVESIRI